MRHDNHRHILRQRQSKRLVRLPPGVHQHQFGLERIMSQADVLTALVEQSRRALPGFDSVLAEER